MCRLTVVGQALIKWRLENLKSKFSTDYSTIVGGAKFLDPIIILALGSAFVALFWLRAMSLLDITSIPINDVISNLNFCLCLFCAR